MSQNFTYDTKHMKDFEYYMNDQIACGKYLKSNVVKIDETNIYFDLTGTMTLVDYGSRTVSVHSALFYLVSQWMA